MRFTLEFVTLLRKRYCLLVLGRDDEIVNVDVVEHDARDSYRGVDVVAELDKQCFHDSPFTALTTSEA